MENGIAYLELRNLDYLNEGRFGTAEEGEVKIGSSKFEGHFETKASRLFIFNEGSANSTAEEKRDKIRSFSFKVWPEP